MRRILKEYFTYFNENRYILVIPVGILFLTTVGLIILSSASLSFIKTNYLFRQIQWFFIALLAFSAALFLPLEKLRSAAKWLYIVAILLLILVLLPKIGLEIKGSKRWLNLGFFHFQVSEFAKVALLFLLADSLSKIERRDRRLKNLLLQPLLLLAPLSLLILLEPDYGTTALFWLVSLTLLFLSGLSFRVLLICGGLLAILFAIFIFLNPVRFARILNFLDLENTKQSGSYQLWQGLIAFDAGGLHGAGLGQGIQQLFYLPEAHTDFIYPILAEELGYPFAALILVTYFLIFLLAWVEIYRLQNRFLFLFSAGIVTFITYQAIINLAVVMGLLPTKGMALPFLSYGGSNLMSVYFLYGLLFNSFRCNYFCNQFLDH